MDAGEAAAKLDDLVLKTKCELKEKKESWNCVLGGNSSNLADNIKRDRKKPKPPLPASMSVKDCGKDTFPSQAHHLIPHTQLAKDPVKQFLKVRIAGEFFERAPILLAGFRLQLGADGRQVQRPMRRRHVVQVFVWRRPIFFVLCLIAHTFHQR